MKISPINENNKQIAKTSLLMGSLVTAANVVAIPKETKKMIIQGKDSFVKHTQDVIKTTTEEALGHKMDAIILNRVAQKAGDFFVTKKKDVVKTLGKSFIGTVATVAAGLAIGSYLGNKIAEKKQA